MKILLPNAYVSNIFPFILAMVTIYISLPQPVLNWSRFANNQLRWLRILGVVYPSIGRWDCYRRNGEMQETPNMFIVHTDVQGILEMVVGFFVIRNVCCNYPFSVVMNLEHEKPHHYFCVLSVISNICYSKYCSLH